MLTRAYIKQILDYDAKTGTFTWLVDRPPRGQAGTVAGYDNGSGYIKISIGGRRYYAHRLAFLWMTGDSPSEIDHINQCRSDNRWANLRASSHIANSVNVRGRTGVRQKYGRWYARLGNKHLGVFDTEDEARETRRLAELAAAGLDPNVVREILPTQIPNTPRRYLYGGRTIPEWSALTGVPKPTIYWRLKQGWPIERAIARRDMTKDADVGHVVGVAGRPSG